MEDGLQFIISFDSDGNPLDGGKAYKFQLPPDIPARNFWSVIAYDNLTRLIVNTEQKWPSVFRNCQTLVTNQDGSVTILFGPDVPVEKNCNFIQTIPGKGWNMVLRLYGPTEAWFDKSWRPGEIDKILQAI